MTEEQILRKVKVLTAEILRLDVDDIEPDCELAGDLGADSLDQVELVMAVEEEFNVAISDEDAEDILTVQDMVDWLAANADD
ncbi:MAG TPA: acyl carrier protein [Prosthecobacter sp.]